MTKKEREALDVIYADDGKKKVYESYLRMGNDEMAKKYLEFISKTVNRNNGHSN